MLIIGGHEVSTNEEKRDIEVKESRERPITPWYPGDVFRAFDTIWEMFSQDFLRPRNLWRLKRAVHPGIQREACTDLLDHGDEFQVFAEVPGIPKDHLDITVTSDSIEIAGKAEITRGEENHGYVVNERGYSQIYRRLSFPEEVASDKATATLTDGLLDIRIPKRTPNTET
jgi:HSP20 family protein